MTNTEKSQSGAVMNIPQGIDRRVTKSGEVSYRVRIRLKGHLPVSKTFKNLTHAKKWKRITESSIEKGEYFKECISTSKTLGEAVDKYIEEFLPYKPKNGRNVQQHLERWKRELGMKKVQEITPSDIAGVRDRLLTEITTNGKLRSSSTVVRYIASISHLYTVVSNEWGWVADNPVAKIKKPKNNQGRLRYLSKEEIPRLLNECKKSRNPYLHTIVLLGIQTGMRKGEILSLRWEDVDFENRWVFLQTTKNNAPRTVPISSEIIDILKARRGNGTELVFPSSHDKNTPIDIRSAWRFALKRANVNDFVVHDLRHTTASHLAMQGYGFGQIAEILGHKSLQMTKRYAHLSNESKRKMLKTMEVICEDL